MVQVVEANSETVWIQELLALLKLLEHSFKKTKTKKKHYLLWMKPLIPSSKHVAAHVRSVEGQFEHVQAQL